MSHDHSTEQDWRGTRRYDTSQDAPPVHAENASHMPSSLLDNAELQGRRNAPIRYGVLREMQQTYGNRAVQRHVQGVQGKALPSVQRSVWDGTNLKDDFWGLKSTFGERAGGSMDAASSAIWNFAGKVPMIGAIGTGIDVGKMMAAESHGDADAAARFKNDAVLSAIGMVPGLNFLGAASGVWDVGATGARALGYDAPTSGDLWDKGVTGNSSPPGANQGGHGGGPQSYPEDVPAAPPEVVPDNGGGHGGGPQNYLSASPMGGGLGLPDVGFGGMPSLKDMGIGSPLMADLGSFF